MIIKSKNLTTIRKLGKAQKQVAEEIGISEIGCQSHERGTRIPSVTTAIKVANALGIRTLQEFCELLGYTNEKVL